MNAQVTEYIGQIDVPWQVEICNQIRNAIYSAVPAVEEQVKYKQAYYTVDSKQLCVFFPAKGWINVTIFNAESLEAPAGFFEKSDKPERKGIKIREGVDFDYSFLEQLLKQVA
ncbi:DUF1801 domain-containing protein [Paenibacillus sp. N1-5-1-14]|uniref:DUF1801 domain-containing protein n=1 Tax=Paenibacillus radicibacter TaxID=2972488 RepID=UPI00215943B4|nr:DUF1801 domain-containing protein [Paenibacillus radicibacter]MCR8642866.1 DUF1801 domain-containing protein [Paenibacillus radicibacter]